MKSGEKCHLSSLRVGDVGNLRGDEFIVVERVPEDRRSGETKIKFRHNGSEEEFYWDTEDPMVTYLRKGKINFDWNDKNG